jgi:gliding motility-associated-like protein
MIRRGKCIIWMRLLIALFALLSYNVSKAVVIIDSAQTTASLCQANGVIEITANGTNAPFIYSIIAGPITRPSQSSNKFMALSAGTYTVMVQNQIGENVTQSVTVTGNYQLMSVQPFSVISCSSANNGYIVGNLTSGGKPPYTWQLVNPSPVLTAPQASDTFYNLPDGTYTIRVTDDCGNFQTTGAVLSSVPSSLSFMDYTNYLFCGDSGKLMLRYNYTNLQFPMRLVVYDDLGDSTVVNINDFQGYPALNTNWNVYAQYQNIQIEVPLHHTVLGGSQWHATITNPCGVRLDTSGFTATDIMPISVGVVANSCPTRLGYSFDVRNSQGMYTMITSDTLKKWYLYDVGLNVIADSGTSSTVSAIAVNGIVGHTYRFILVNTCNQIFTSLDWVWADPAPPIVYPYPVGRECLDSTINLVIQTQGFNIAHGLTWVLHSGPSTAHSTKPGFEFFANLHYPDTTINLSDGVIEYKNLPPGTYAFSVWDSCGLRIDSTFTILPESIDDKRYIFTSTIIGQCGVYNAINLYINRGDKYAYPFPLPHFTYTITNLSTQQVIETDNVADSVSKVIYNIPNGTYTIKIDFFEFLPNQGEYLNNNQFCTIVYDTIVVKGSPFPHINNFINSFCRANITTQLVIDSFAGVAPYTYEVIAGPQLFPPQTSNIFNLPVTGTYTFRMVDACGNSYVSATDIDTLTFPPIEVLNTPCPGANVLLIPVVSPFYKYRWRKPDGTFVTGDTLAINGVAAVDTGFYTVTRYADINGCKDTLTTTVHLEMLARVSQSLSLCAGDTIKVGNHNYTTTGVYIDTLTAALGCDSIVTTNITLIPAKFSSQAFTPCVGEVVVVGPYAHSVLDTITHVYVDTLISSSGCDSIVTVTIKGNRTAGSMDSIVICQGDTVRLRRELHYSGTVSIDTAIITNSQFVLTGLFPLGNGCDSSSVVHVIVRPSYFTFKRDTICQGQSLQIGTSVYYTSGGYLDTLTSTSGCDSIVLLVLTVKAPDTTQLNMSICAGQSINGHSHMGVFVDTFTNSNGCDSVVVLTLAITHIKRDSIARQICTGSSFAFGGKTYNQTGVYSDTIATAFCDSIVTLILTVDDYLRDSIVQTICNGTSIQFGGVVYSSAGIYRDTLGTSTCDSIVTLNLIVRNMPHDTIIRSICSSQSITIGGSTYNQTGIYVDTLSTINCDSIVTLILSVGDYAASDTTIFICPGDSITIGQFTYSQQGSYADTIPSTPCDSISVINITYYQPPVFLTSADDTMVIEGDTVFLHVTSNQALIYTWTSNPAVSDIHSSNPISVINEPTWFVVTGTDSLSQCSAIDSVFIDLTNAVCRNYTLFMPNVFTPNSDGSNDMYSIYYTCPIKKFNIKIFNRWGEKVFESNDPDFKWNGYYKGALLTPAVFVYVLVANYENQQYDFKKGSITLLR